MIRSDVIVEFRSCLHWQQSALLNADTSNFLNVYQSTSAAVFMRTDLCERALCRAAALQVVQQVHSSCGQLDFAQVATKGCPSFFIPVQTYSMAYVDHLTSNAEPGIICKHPSKVCLDCGGAVLPHNTHIVQAVVLDVGGWVPVTHIPLRCRRQCAWADKHIWHNFVSMESNKLIFQWPVTEEMEYVFLMPQRGGTTAWLRQFSQRLLHHFASCRGEAAVHLEAARRSGNVHLVPNHSHIKLQVAWCMWRLVRTLVASSTVNAPVHVRSDVGAALGVDVA